MKTARIDPPETAPTTFPLLVEHDDGSLALATSEERGVWIHPSNGEIYSEGWYTHKGWSVVPTTETRTVTFQNEAKP